MTSAAMGDVCVFEDDEHRFAQLGYSLAVLQPGQRGAQYHRELDNPASSDGTSCTARPASLMASSRPARNHASSSCPEHDRASGRCSFATNSPFSTVSASKSRRPTRTKRTRRCRSGSPERRRPGVKFLALSVSDAAEDVIGVIRAGARGYVTKTISGAGLADAIDRVAGGDAVFSPRSAGFVLDAFREGEPIGGGA